MQTNLLYILLVVCCTSVHAEPSSAIEPGQWLEIRGQFTNAKQFVAEKITVTEPDDEAAITGTPNLNDQGQLMLLGHVLKLEEGATFQGIDRGQLPTVRVKAEGELARPWIFSVEEIKRRGVGRDRIEGPVDQVETVAGEKSFSVLGYQVQLTKNTVLSGFDQNRYPKLSVASAPDLFHSHVSARHSDDDDRFGQGIRLGDHLRLKSRIVGESAWEDNFNFDDIDDEDRQDLGLSLRARLEWQPASVWSGVFELRYNARHREREDRRNTDDSDLDIGEAYIRRQLNDSTFITLGRQDFDDDREWLFDVNLDAIRVTTEILGNRLEASVSKIIADDGSREEEAINYIASVGRNLFGGTLSTYYINRDFARAHSEVSHHYVVRAIGPWLQSDQLWVDFALQRGDRGRSQIDAYAIDVGGTWRLGRNDDWYLTTGVAHATGDDPSTADDETFRQTGLQDNNGRFGGLVSFRYYGELSDPELSNLWVASVGVGKRIRPQLSLDLIAHNYRLDRRATALDEVEWDSDLTGSSTKLGWETDLVVGLRGFQRWEAEAVVGYFKPGSAFVDTQAAWFGKLQVKFRH